MADPTNPQPGMYESAVRAIIKSAWGDSQTPSESTTHSSTPPTDPDTAVPVVDILKAVEEAVALLGRQIDEMYKRLEG